MVDFKAWNCGFYTGNPSQARLPSLLSLLHLTGSLTSIWRLLLIFDVYGIICPELFSTNFTGRVIGCVTWEMLLLYCLGAKIFNSYRYRWSLYFQSLNSYICCSISNEICWISCSSIVWPSENPKSAFFVDTIQIK